MPKIPTISQRKTRPRTASVRKIRLIMGRTQAELALALGCSRKAIESYEQGWRPVPVRVLIQLLVLLALQRKPLAKQIPCWEIRRCGIGKRKACPAFTVSNGLFCWFVAAKKCREELQHDKDAAWACMDCKVVKTLLQSSDDAALEKARKVQGGAE
ncbi:MAG: transcriptional regulator [Verrucomicrobia bacterium]|nr:transcriptional regulator [Verrucomicrobiota bacterium]